MNPEGYLYTKDHEWAKIEDGVAIMGITEHAQEQLGELTFVELPAAGQEVEVGDELGVVESSKAASDIYSPVTGTVTDINANLEDKPELINEDCYEAGWICKIDITDENSYKDLMDAEAYEEFLKEL